MGLSVCLDGSVFQADCQLAISRQHGRNPCQGTIGKGTSQAKGQTGNDRALRPWRTIFVTKNEERDQNVQAQTEHAPRR